MSRRGRAVILLGLLSAIGLRAGPWPAVDSDLPPDPAIRQGTLPNGLRYVVRPNAGPRGRASLRLLVAAGSLDERDDERGLAHFIEHMAFRGTRRHPDGTLTAELQRLGIGAGPDNSASTFWDRTIYRLELPDTAAATLREGLGVLREYAEDITFDPDLIDRERGVILEERDLRDTPGARAADDNLAFLWPGSLEARRNPIGLESAIRGFARPQFVGFYDAWYRPGRMAVIVVGDLDPRLAVRLVAEIFGPLRPRGPARAAAPALPPAAAPPAIRVFVDPGLAGVTCTFERPFPVPREPDTHEARAAQLQRALAFAMFQHRLANLALASDGLFVRPAASVTTPLPGWGLAQFSASGKIDRWQAFLAALEQEFRRALQHGFTASELAMARAGFAAAHAEAVRTAATWPSGRIAGQIADSLVQGRVLAGPALLQRNLAADLAATTPAQCLAAFRSAWGPLPPHVFLATNPLAGITSAQISAVLARSRAVAVAPPPDLRPAAFAYTRFGPPGRLVRQTHVADLDVWQAAFANGVRLNLKPTAFAADTVEICVRVGTGRLSLPPDQPGLDQLAAIVVPQGGLGRHSLDELQNILAGHSVALSFAMDDDAFDFIARCSRRDLLLCFQLIAAHLTDSAFRPGAMPAARAAFDAGSAALAASPDGPIALRAVRLLAGGDARFGPPAPAELQARTIAEVRAWLEPQFRNGPVEIGLAGDVTPGEAIAAVAATLGALPPRQPRAALPVPPALQPPGRPDQPAYITTGGSSSRQAALAWFCLVPDADEIHRIRRCYLLADLLADRLRLRLRDQLGAAYDCEAHFFQFDGFPNFSYFALSTAVAPTDAGRARRLIGDEIENLRQGRFTDDDFARVKAPFVREREQDLLTNGYWSQTVLADAQQRPERLAAVRDRTADCASIRRDEIEALAQRYFPPDRWFQFAAYPAAPPEPPSLPPAAR